MNVFCFWNNRLAYHRKANDDDMACLLRGKMSNNRSIQSRKRQRREDTGHRDRCYYVCVSIALDRSSHFEREERTTRGWIIHDDDVRVLSGNKEVLSEHKSVIFVNRISSHCIASHRIASYHIASYETKTKRTKASERILGTHETSPRSRLWCISYQLSKSRAFPPPSLTHLTMR